MRLLLFIFALTSFSVFANPISTQEEHSDAFHNSAFGGVERQEQQEEEVPEWITPEVEQRMEEGPAVRVNEWQEQSKRAKEGEE